MQNVYFVLKLIIAYDRILTFINGFTLSDPRPILVITEVVSFFNLHMYLKIDELHTSIFTLKWLNGI